MDESVMGGWAEVLTSMGQPLPTNDPMVKICNHCKKPKVECQKILKQVCEIRMSVSVRVGVSVRVALNVLVSDC